MVVVGRGSRRMFMGPRPGLPQPRTTVLRVRKEALDAIGDTAGTFCVTHGRHPANGESTAVSLTRSVVLEHSLGLQRAATTELVT